MNLSDIELNDDQISILSSGSSFCPSPAELDMSELLQDLEKFTFGRKGMDYLTE